jgi:magnesium transporter
MPKSRKKRSLKAGLPPGTLVHIGTDHAEPARATLIEYGETRLVETDASSLEGVGLEPDREGVLWLHIDGLSNIGLLEEAGKSFGLHTLTLEDILNTEQRPKFEDYGEYLYVVMKYVYLDSQGRLDSDQVSILLGDNWVISVQEKASSLLEPIRSRLRSGMGRLRKFGADYLAHALIDGIVDSCFVVLDHFGERIEELENTALLHPTPEILQDIQALKRDIIQLRRSVWPLREMILSLSRTDSTLIREPSQVYFRDVADHAVQVAETIETYRDMLFEMLDIYLTGISNRMNEVMKVLTVIATLFMPLTFIAGVYGMNFRYMPELEWRWGYLTVWGVMAVVAGCMMVYFRSRKWL